MTFGEKITLLRETNRYTREQLAELLGVSQLSVESWESDAALPDAGQVIRMSDLFHCTPEELLRDDRAFGETSIAPDPPAREKAPDAAGDPSGITPTIRVRRGGLYLPIRERKSSLTVLGMPLWEIGHDARAVIAIGSKARGFLAVGIRARGIIALGMFAMGVLSFGVMSLGVIALGSLAAGLIAAGAVAFGPVAVGALAVGIVAAGAVAVGDFAAGAAAIGRFLAVGESARAQIALGFTEAVGSVYAAQGMRSPADVAFARQWLENNVPAHLGWALSLARSFFL